MDKTQYYIYASPDDSKDIHTKNNISDFVVELPSTLNLEGVWEIGLLEAEYSQNVHSDKNLATGSVLGTVFLFCDLCEESFIRGKMLPVLQKLNRSRTFEPPNFVRMKPGGIQRFRVYMKDSEMNPVSVADWKLKCTLLFRKGTWNP